MIVREAGMHPAQETSATMDAVRAVMPSRGVILISQWSVLSTALRANLLYCGF